MKITVLLFAQLSELFETNSIEMNDVTSLNDLVHQLEKAKEAFKNQKYTIAINESITKENVTLKEGDVVALLPPFAGG